MTRDETDTATLARNLALTRRQQQVAELVAEGLSNADVAARLGISTSTVLSSLCEVYAKTGLGGAGPAARRRLTRWVQDGQPPVKAPGPREMPLNETELAAALLAAVHVPRREIAPKLGVSPLVLANQLRHVYQKARIAGGKGKQDRLAAWLRERGLLP